MTTNTALTVFLTLWIATMFFLTDAKVCYISTQMRNGCFEWKLSTNDTTKCTSIIFGGFKNSLEETNEDEIVSPFVSSFLQNKDTSSCPTNMLYQTCSCQGTCDNPNSCHGNQCAEAFGCVCPEGFLIKGGDCVPLTECGCYFLGSVIQNGDFAVTSDCSVKCWCRSSTLNCIGHYRCGTHASCHQDGNVGQCKCIDGYYGDGDKCEPLPSDCLEWYKIGFREDNVYDISPVGWNRPNVKVYCDMGSGGWTVIQRRSDPNVNFYRGWSDYKAGFGDKRGDFWLGNDVIHYVTSQEAYILQVDITSVDNNMHRYDMGPFLIGPESKNYRLEYGLYGSEGIPFSTYDHYGDAWRCVKLHEGAWWYGNMHSHCSTVDVTSEVACNYANDDVTGCYATCTNNNLNGKFDTSLFWNGTNCNIRKTEMKILPSW